MAEQNTMLTIEEIREGCKDVEGGARVCFMNEEMRQGLDFVKKYPHSITIFGSARFKEDDHFYGDALELSCLLSKHGYTIVTGGGGGIMEAANRGAHEVGGHSVGMSIELPKEQETNAYVTDSIEFYYFFNRKVALAFSANAFFFFPGGFGTMDEVFEILTLIQTKKIPQVPIIFYGKDFWNPLLKGVLQDTFMKYGTIDEHAMSLFEVADSAEEAHKKLTQML